MLIWLVFAGYGVFSIPATTPITQRISAGGIILFLLMLILGWATFGSPVK